MRTVKCVSFLIGIMFLCCICSPEWGELLFPWASVPLVADYELVDSDWGSFIGQPAGSGHVVVVHEDVVQIGWNSDFILAKQEPTSPALDYTSTRWFIIDVANGEVYGPLIYQEFVDMQGDIFIPSGIELLDVNTVWRESRRD